MFIPEAVPPAQHHPELGDAREGLLLCFCVVSPSSFPQNELPPQGPALGPTRVGAQGAQRAGGLELRPPMLLGTVPGIEVKVEVLVT